MHKYTDSEKEYIYGLSDGGLSVKQIIEKVGRSESGIYKVLSKRYEKKHKKQQGRPHKLTERDKRQIVTSIKRNKGITLGEIKNSFGGDVSKATIRRAIHESGINPITNVCIKS